MADFLTPLMTGEWMRLVTKFCKGTGVVWRFGGSVNLVSDAGAYCVPYVGEQSAMNCTAITFNRDLPFHGETFETSTIPRTNVSLPTWWLADSVKFIGTTP
jgi:hypothetical protein